MKVIDKGMNFFKRVPSRVWIVFVLLLVLRLGLAFTSDQSLEGDPASIAVMGVSTLKTGELHYFIYGEPYIGGAAIEAYLSAITFALFGISDFSFQIVSLFLAVVLFFLMYGFVRKYFGERPAFFSVLLFVFSPLIFSRLNIMGISSYMENLIFFMLLTILFYRIFVDKKDQIKNMIWFGVVAGIGWWNLEYVIAYLVFFIAFWWLMDKKFVTKKLFWVFVVSLGIALSPLIYYNVTHNFDNIKHFLAGTAVHEFACDQGWLGSAVPYGDRIIDPCHIFKDRVNKPLDLYHFFTWTLLLTFGNWGYYFFSVVALVFIIWLMRKSYPDGIKSIWIKHNLNLSKHPKVLYLVGFFLFWFVIYTLSGRSDPKHFSPVFPFMIILMAIAIDKLMSKKRLIGSIILGGLLIFGVIPNIQALFDADVNDISGVVSFLEEQGISHVYTDHPGKWKILFKTQEEIVASCNICPCVNPNKRIEAKMVNDKDTAYVLYQFSNLKEKLVAHLEDNDISFSQYTVNGYTIVYGLSEAIDPKEVLGPCSWHREQWSTRYLDRIASEN